MNPTNDWFQDGDAPHPGTLRIHEPIKLSTAGDVRAFLLEHPGPGWVCTTGRVGRVPAADLPGDEIPLAAEIALSDSESLHLRQAGDRWTAWRLEEDLHAGGEHRYFDDSFASTEDAARLRYRTWWRLEEEDTGSFPLRVWRPFAFRFLGWTEDD